METDILIFADTAISADMRHEIPFLVPDPFLYAEHDGKRYAVVPSLEVPRFRALDPLSVIAYEELGSDELARAGADRDEIHLPIVTRFCEQFGIERAAVPSDFPLELADRLHAAGVELRADRALFAARRRAKNEAELEGIRRAQRAAEQAMDSARRLLAEATGDVALSVGGQPLTCERIKQAIRQVFVDHEMLADDFIVSHGAQSAVGHDMGSGPILAGEPVIVDLFFRDQRSGCFTDMTRTFVVGEPPGTLVEYHRLCLQALEEAVAKVAPGVAARDLFTGTCDLFERNGYSTLRNKAEGHVLESGFIHNLGHGVGLNVHEQPFMSLASKSELLPGDVIAIEPGLYQAGFGGCRLEDLILVTEDGAETLTHYPYDLAP